MSRRLSLRRRLVLGIVALPRSRVYRVAVVVAFVGLQWVWLYSCWWIDGYDWTPP